MRRLIISLADLDNLARDVLDRDGTFKFQASGGSMSPFLHNGDILTIQSVDPFTLKVGDVILHRGVGDRPIAHRITTIQPHNTHLAITTRGDASSGPEELVSEQDVLGKVIRLKRGGKTIPLETSGRRVSSLLWIKLHPLVATGFKLRDKLIGLATRVLRRTQSHKTYRLIARRILKGKTHFTITTQEDIHDLPGMYRYNHFFEPEQCNDTTYQWLAHVGNNTAGSLTLRRFSEGETNFSGWWIFGMLVRQRYQGAGIGQQLLQLALDRAKLEGATSIHLLVFEDNDIAIKLYQKMGFCRTSLPKLDLLLEEEALIGARRRIAMSRSI